MTLGLADVKDDHGIRYIAAYDADTGNVVFTHSQQPGTFAGYGPGFLWSTPVTVAASDQAQPAIAFCPTAEIIVSVTQAGVIRNYGSKDYGAHWSIV